MGQVEAVLVFPWLTMLWFPSLHLLRVSGSSLVKSCKNPSHFEILKNETIVSKVLMKTKCLEIINLSLIPNDYVKPEYLFLSLSSFISTKMLIRGTLTSLNNAFFLDIKDVIKLSGTM